uniref:M61 family metallopeptidase n=1 Tax=Roseivirga sp. TaxID=1964215 RepID=UPI0040480937
MHYTISYGNPNKHIIDIALELSNIEQDQIELNLPSWRPGRYTIQNFAKNIMNIQAYDENGNTIACEKVTKDKWIIESTGLRELTIKYSYYAFLMDAGNSWLDEEQLYINFINCLLYAEGRLSGSCSLEIKVPEDYKFATGLEQVSPQLFKTDSYYHLVDSPLIATKNLKKISYEVQGYQFYLWIVGEFPRTEEDVVNDFRRFTELQIEVMGDFPCKDYHFIYQCLPYRHYHGVEHWNSTVITLGPSSELNERPLYKEFLGVSCHELFHTWNVIRLRPKEMVPYDFQSENYHETGFVTEGVTTYYGDLFLKRSGVFSLEEYLVELNKLLERHFLNDGRKNMSVASSSYDLWLDGYEKGVPGRKVSIYNEGALLALILDLKVRIKTDYKKSLDDVMKLMWVRFGENQKGYMYEDYQQVCEEVYGSSLSDYFEHYISGTEPFEKELSILFPQFGFDFELKSSAKPEEKRFGFKVAEQGGRHFIDALAANSPAEEVLSLKDEVLNYGILDFEKSQTIHLEINRFGRKLNFELTADERDHFSIYQLSLSDQGAMARSQWLGK